MTTKQPQLRKGQIDILEILFKYRFSSRQLVADSLGINVGTNIYKRLEVLVKHGLVTKTQEKHLKLQGKPAAYFLTPQGLRALQMLPKHEYITNSVIKSSYKDRTVKRDFIDHHLNVHKYTNLLKSHYQDTLKVFANRELKQYSYFPTQLPDAFLSLKSDDPQQPYRFFFDFVEDSVQRFVLDRRVATYCDFFDAGGWDMTGSEVPTLLFVAATRAGEKRLQRNIRARLSRSDMEELRVLTTTKPALDHIDSEGMIWRSTDEPDVLIGFF